MDFGQERLHQDTPILERLGDVSSVAVEFLDAKTVAAVGAAGDGRLDHDFIPTAGPRQGGDVGLVILCDANALARSKCPQLVPNKRGPPAAPRVKSGPVESGS